MGDQVEAKPVIIPENITRELDQNETLELCKSVGVTIEDIKALTQKNKEYAELEKEIKPLKDKIKSALISANAKNGMFGDIKLSVTIQNRDTLDEDRLVNLLKSKGLEDAILTVEKPDPEKLPGLISQGLIVDEDIQSCMIPNKVVVLNFPRAKKTAKAQGEEMVNNLNIKTKKSSMF